MILRDLAALLSNKGFYIFPLVKGEKIPLRGSNAFYDSSSDSEKVKSLWTYNDGSAAEFNIGINTGKFLTDKALVVVDIDYKPEKEKDGFESMLELGFEGLTFPETFTVETPSGGRHLYYISDIAYPSGTDVLGRGLDIRSRGGYVVGPGSVTQTGSYKVVDQRAMVEVPEWIRARLQKHQDLSKKVLTNAQAAHVDKMVGEQNKFEYAESLLSNYPPAVEGSHGTTHTYKLFCRLKDYALTSKEAFDAVIQSGWNATCVPPWSLEELTKICVSAYKYGVNSRGSELSDALEAFESIQEVYEFDECDQVVQDFNKKFALADRGGNIFVAETDIDGDIIKEYNERSFKSKFGNVLISKPDGRKPERAVDFWHSSPKRRTVEIYFDPSKDYRFDPPGKYNMFRGFEVKAESWDEASDQAREALTVLKDHVYENVCNKNDELNKIFWSIMAWKFQRPSQKLTIAPALISPQRGTGKSIIPAMIKNLMGNYARLGAMKNVTSRFNNIFENTLFFCIEEAYRTTNDEYNATLRDLITNPYIEIERKGESSYPSRNYINVMITSNFTDVCDVAYTERRIVPMVVQPNWIGRKDLFDKMGPFLNADDLDNRLLMGAMFEHQIDQKEVYKIWDVVNIDSHKRMSMDDCDSFVYEAIENDELRGYVDIKYGKGEAYGCLNLLQMYEDFRIRSATTGTKAKLLPQAVFSSKVISLIMPGGESKQFRNSRGERERFASLKLENASIDGFINLLELNFKHFTGLDISRHSNLVETDEIERNIVHLFGDSDA